MNKERFITYLGTVTATSQATSLMTVLLDYLSDQGQADLVRALIPALSASGLLASTVLPSSLVLKVANDKGSGHTNHDR